MKFEAFIAEFGSQLVAFVKEIFAFIKDLNKGEYGKFEWKK